YALVDVSVDGLEEGAIIRLGDLGSIRVTTSSEGRATAEEVNAACIKKTGIVFVPGQRIKKTLENVEFVKTN
ncbi:MAG: DNA-binding protein, partial [Prevotellaceae bacterium]|nr:DNA-binding protein [Prevotellaceae bacterium]